MANSIPVRDRPRPTPRKRRPPRNHARWRQIVVLVVTVLAVLTVVHGLSFRGEVAPGVSVHGIDIGGLSPADAKALLHDNLSPQLDKNVIVTLDTQTAAVNPAELDARIDINETVDRAMRTGRLRSLLLPFVYSASVDPSIITPGQPRVPANLRLVAEPARSATVSISQGKTTISPARNGHSISTRAILLAAAQAALAGRRKIKLTSTATKPAISTADARAAAASAEALASAPVALNVDGNRVGALSTATLQSAIMVRNENGTASAAFDPKKLAPAIDEALGDRIREPRNAVWGTNGTRAWVEPAKDGIGFDPRAAADAVRAAALAGGARQADLQLDRIPPKRSTAEAEEFEITEKVAGAITELGDSSSNRTHNVALMAEILDNRLVMPGETFSFNDSVGPRSPERGFLEGLAIVDGLMLPSIGGGVCQVATTLYDAAFAMGLQIVDRRNHGFFISQYGLGMDATVSWPDLDLKFNNNTSHPILIRATSDASTMLVNLYSAPSDGRTVETSVSERYEIKPSEKRYMEDPFAPAKQIIKYVDGQEGFAVDVTRDVTRDGEVLSHDVFVSTYASQPATYIVGPGAFPPGDNVLEPPPYGWVSPYDPNPPKPVF